MSTIASTSRESYTITGSHRPKEEADSLSFLLLCRGGRPFREAQLRKILALRPREVLSVGPGRGDDLAAAFPQVRFVLYPGDISVGEQINIAIQEATGSHVLAFWDDMDLQPSRGSQDFFQNACNQTVLCSVPRLLDDQREALPTQMVPVFQRGQLKVLNLKGIEEPTLYPFDYCGLYRRDLFLAMGGYDPLIPQAHWQKMDFGFRAFLGGQEIRGYKGIQLLYQHAVPPEDITPSSSYSRFFLKTF